MYKSYTFVYHGTWESWQLIIRDARNSFGADIKIDCTIIGQWVFARYIYEDIKTFKHQKPSALDTEHVCAAILFTGYEYLKHSTVTVFHGEARQKNK